jgi:hypothetical protein
MGSLTVPHPGFTLGPCHESFHLRPTDDALVPCEDDCPNAILAFLGQAKLEALDLGLVLLLTPNPTLYLRAKVREVLFAEGINFCLPFLEVLDLEIMVAVGFEQPEYVRIVPGCVVSC